MLDNKNLIEIVKIDGLDVAIERHNGNFSVSLTSMSKRYGPNKAPDRWLRTNEAKEFINAIIQIESVRQKWRTESSDLIITKQGGDSKKQGTWCTDRRIAIRYAMWLNPVFAVLVIEAFEKIVSGQSIVSEEGYFSLGGKQWVSCYDYCKILHKTPHSFYGLLGHYKRDFAWWDGQWYMSRELFSMKDLQAKLDNHRLDIKSKYDENQLQLPFVEEIKED